MSFGFGIGDFMALSKLTMSLYKSFRGAPGEFVEVSRQLRSVYILIEELRDQVQEQGSLVNRLGAVPRKELGVICGNLRGVMGELEDLKGR